MGSSLRFHSALTTFLVIFVNHVLADRVYGIAYSPYRQYGVCPSLLEIIQDKDIAMAHTSRVRLYSTECHVLNDVILELATTHDVEVLMGVWIDGNPFRDQQAMEDLYYYIRKYPNAKLLGIAVGNEVLYRGTLSPSAMAQKVAEVKQRVREIGYEIGSYVLQSVPVFSVDVIPHPEVVAVSDAIGVNVHPFFRMDMERSDDPYQMADLALHCAMEQITTLQNLYPGKEVFVTETGWPSASAEHEYHRGSIDISKLYQQKFIAWGDAVGLKYFWFELVDSPWKHAQFPNEPQTMSEFHWGMYSYDRILK